MEATQGYSQGTARGFRQKIQENIFRRLGWLIYCVLRFAAVFLIGIFVFLGIINTYDVLIGDSNVPEINSLASIEECKLAMQVLDMPEEDFSEEKAWESIKPSLRILRSVCPAAATWVEERHAVGKLKWRSPNALATYNPFSGEVCLNKSLLSGSSYGNITITLAHEFRHSRQNISKYFKVGITLLLTGNVRSEIIENDAYLFQHEISRAICR